MSPKFPSCTSLQSWKHFLSELFSAIYATDLASFSYFNLLIFLLALLILVATVAAFTKFVEFSLCSYDLAFVRCGCRLFIAFMVYINFRIIYLFILWRIIGDLEALACWVQHFGELLQMLREFFRNPFGNEWCLFNHLEVRLIFLFCKCIHIPRHEL